MSIKNRSKLVSEEILSSSVLSENTRALDLYKGTQDILKEIADIMEKIDIAMGRKQIYICTSGSTENCEINPYAIPPTTSSYEV